MSTLMRCGSIGNLVSGASCSEGGSGGGGRGRGSGSRSSSSLSGDRSSSSPGGGRSSSIPNGGRSSGITSGGRSSSIPSGGRSSSIPGGRSSSIPSGGRSSSDYGCTTMTISTSIIYVVVVVVFVILFVEPIHLIDTHTALAHLHAFAWCTLFLECQQQPSITLLRQFLLIRLMILGTLVQHLEQKEGSIGHIIAAEDGHASTHIHVGMCTKNRCIVEYMFACTNVGRFVHLRDISRATKWNTQACQHVLLRLGAPIHDAT